MGVGKTAILSVRVVTDAKSGQQGLADYGKSIDQVEKKLDGLTVPAGIVVAAIGATAKAASDAAATQQQAAAAVDRVYGDQAKTVKSFAEDAVNSAGLSASAYDKMAAVIGTALQNAGVAHDDLADKTQTLITLGADLSATYGGSTSDAVNALTKAVQGGTKGLKAYGISLTASQVAAEVTREGNDKLTGSQLTAATQQATLTLILQKATDANGAFADSAGNATVQQAKANASWEDAQEKLGAGLLPLIAAGSGLLSDFAGWVTQNSTAVEILVGVVGALAAGVLIINGALKVYEAIQTAATAAQWLFDAALDANPIGLVVIAIGLLIAIVVLLVTHWKEVSEWGSQVWDGFIQGAQDAIQWVRDAIDWVGKLLGFNGGWAALSNEGGRGGDDSNPGGGFDPTDFDSPSEGTGGWPVWPSSVGSSQSLTPSVTNNTWNISGAVDAASAARQINSLQNRNGKNTGALALGSATFLG